MTADETTTPARAGPGAPRRVAAALAISLLLVVGANALGLLARLSALALRRFSAWWPPQSLEPLPLGVAGLLILVTAYALATRGSRMRAPGLSGHRRFLPPLDLLLLQLGNVTFMAFALIFALVACGLLSVALRAVVTGSWLAARGLTVSLVAAAAVALVGLRGPGATKRRARQRPLAGRAAILGGAGGGFWLIGQEALGSLLQIRLADSQVDLRTLALLYGLLWILLAGSALARRFELPTTGSPERSWLGRWLATGPLLTWLAYLGFLTLYLNGTLLTLRGHLAAN